MSKKYSEKLDAEIAEHLEYISVLSNDAASENPEIRLKAIEKIKVLFELLLKKYEIRTKFDPRPFFINNP